MFANTYINCSATGDLLECIQKEVDTKCGSHAADFVHEYVKLAFTPIFGHHDCDLEGKTLLALHLYSISGG